MSIVTRPLSDVEAALLARILQMDHPGAEAARAQLPFALYGGPSHGGGDMCFDIVVQGDVPLIKQLHEHDPMFGVQVDEASEPIGDIAIWVSEGRLYSLEYSWYTDEAPTRLPDLDQLRDGLQTIPEPKPPWFSWPAKWKRRRP